MTTLQQIELQCPICETRFRSQTVVSTNSFGGKRTDFHERAAGTQPLPYLIHTCSRCGYSGADRDFTDGADVSPILKERVWSELAPAISNGTRTGSEKYEAAAKVADWQGRFGDGQDFRLDGIRGVGQNRGLVIGMGSNCPRQSPVTRTGFCRRSPPPSATGFTVEIWA